MITSFYNIASSLTSTAINHDIEFGGPYQVTSYDSLALTGLYNCSFNLQAFETVEGYFEYKPAYISQLPIIEPSAADKEVLDRLVGKRMGLDGHSAARIDG